MADDVIKTVYVQLETRGDVRPGLEDAERAAERSQQRLKATMMGGGKYDAGDAMMADINANFARQQQMQSRAATGGGTAASTNTNWMAAGMGRASANSSMIEKMNRASTTFDHAGNFIPLAKEAKGLTDEERLRKESNRQLGIFGRETEQAWRGLDKLGRSLTGTGGLGSVMGAAGPMGMAAAAGAAQMEMGQKLLALSQSTVALVDPGRAYRLHRAQMDLGASVGRGLIPLHDEQERATRSLANFAAANPSAITQGEAVARRLTFGLAGQLLPKAANWLGKGHEGASNDAAIHPELGQTFDSAMGYDRSLSQALSTQTPVNAVGRESATQQEASSKFMDAVTLFATTIATITGGPAAGAAVFAGEKILR